jgi:undecaprenyl-diphosphatase
LNTFDLGILHFLNTFAQRNMAADEVLWTLTRNVLVLGGVPFTLFWYAWFHDRDARSENREFLIFGLLAAMASLFIARVIAEALPFRVRPLHNPALSFMLPHGADPSTLVGWSSFPSDHAAVFFCLAATLWFVSKPLGGLAFFHAIFVVSLPRVYFGIHYPTDVIAGAVLGIGVASLCKIANLRKAATRPLLHWMDTRPDIFYAALFFFTFEAAELLNSVRNLVLRGLHLARLL